MTLTVHTSNGELAEELDGVVVLDEAREYHVRAPKNADIRMGTRALASDATGRVTFQTSFAVGTLWLEARSEHGVKRVQLRVRPAAEKLPDALWAALVSDLEAWLPTVTTGTQGPQHGTVGSAGVAAALLAEALLPLLPAFERALAAVLDAPRTRPIDPIENAKLRSVRRVDREMMGFLVRHPAVAQVLEPWADAERQGEEPLVPRRRSDTTLDHAANRYVAWLVLKVASSLRAVGRRLAELSRSARDDEETTWCEARAAACERGSELIERRFRRSFLRDLRREPATEAALLVVSGDPAYARLHALGRRFVSPRFSLDGDGPDAAVRPSFHLYELWCLLAVHRALSAAAPGFTWTSRGFDALLSLRGSGGGASIQGIGGPGTIELHFNRTFAGWFAHSGDCYSISTERRPDITVSYNPSDGTPGAWVCLDAKYRVGHKNLGDAFTSAHIYAHALRWEPFSGACRAAVLLSPARTLDTSDWFEASFRKRFATGAFALAPGSDTGMLADWLLDTLGVPQTGAQVDRALSDSDGGGVVGLDLEADVGVLKLGGGG